MHIGDTAYSAADLTPDVLATFDPNTAELARQFLFAAQRRADSLVLAIWPDTAPAVAVRIAAPPGMRAGVLNFVWSDRPGGDNSGL